MFVDSDKILDLSRQCCWQGSEDASKPCTWQKPSADEVDYRSYSDWPLCRVKPEAFEVYRLVVSPSFSGWEVYCVAIDNDIGDLWWQTCDGLILTHKLRCRRGLSKSFFAPLFVALEAVQFWDAESERDNVMTLDGHHSTFEGMRENKYRRIGCSSPRGLLADLERAFTELAGVTPDWR